MKTYDYFFGHLGYQNHFEFPHKIRWLWTIFTEKAWGGEFFWNVLKESFLFFNNFMLLWDVSFYVHSHTTGEGYGTFPPTGKLSVRINGYFNHLLNIIAVVLSGATQLNPIASNPFQTNPSSNQIKLYFPQISGWNPLVISPIPSYNLRSNLSSITRTLVQILVNCSSLEFLAFGFSLLKMTVSLVKVTLLRDWRDFMFNRAA